MWPAETIHRVNWNNGSENDDSQMPIERIVITGTHFDETHAR
jgi:hypothetical protein